MVLHTLILPEELLAKGYYKRQPEKKEHIRTSTKGTQNDWMAIGIQYTIRIINQVVWSTGTVLKYTVRGINVSCLCNQQVSHVHVHTSM